MESNEDVIEARPDKRRSNSAETGGILPPQQIPITTRVPQPSPNSLQQFNPVGYPITHDPPVPPLQGSSIQPWPYRPPVPIGQQGEFLNWSSGTFLTAPAWPGTYPQTALTHQPQQYSIPLNIYGSNEVGPSQSLIPTLPAQVDLTQYATFSLTICSFL